MGRTEIYPKENEAVEIHCQLAIVDGKRLYTDRGYLDQIIIRTLAIGAMNDADRFKITVERVQ